MKCTGGGSILREVGTDGSQYDPRLDMQEVKQVFISYYRA